MICCEILTGNDGNFLYIGTVWSSFSVVFLEIFILVNNMLNHGVGVFHWHSVGFQRRFCPINVSVEAHFEVCFSKLPENRKDEKCSTGAKNHNSWQNVAFLLIFVQIWSFSWSTFLMVKWSLIINKFEFTLLASTKFINKFPWFVVKGILL